MTAPACSDCGERWRIELTDLRTGVVRAVAVPIRIDIETRLNEPGQGGITISLYDNAIRDVFPGLTGIVIIHKPTNTPRFCGYIERLSADCRNGTATLGLRTMDAWLDRQHLENGAEFTDTQQTVIGAELVNIAASESNTPCVRGIADTSTRFRDRVYEPWSYKNVGEAIEQLTEVVNGPDYEVQCTRTGGAWCTDIIFRDKVGAELDLILSSRQAVAAGIDIDQSDQATHVHGVGEGEEADQLTSQARDFSIFPRWEASPAWKDVNRQSTLDEHTRGYLADHKDPVAVPNITMAGPGPWDTAELGDSVNADICCGLATYKGRAEIATITWRATPGTPDQVTFGLAPLEPSTQTVLGQTPCNPDCEDCQ